MTDDGSQKILADRRRRTYPPRSVCFVLPVFNEKPSLPALHESITQVMAARPETYELLFVDDGSEDGSFDALQELASGDPHVRVIQAAFSSSR